MQLKLEVSKVKLRVHEDFYGRSDTKQGGSVQVRQRNGDGRICSRLG